MLGLKIAIFYIVLTIKKNICAGAENRNINIGINAMNASFAVNVESIWLENEKECVINAPAIGDQTDIMSGLKMFPL